MYDIALSKLYSQELSVLKTEALTGWFFNCLYNLKDDRLYRHIHIDVESPHINHVNHL